MLGLRKTKSRESGKPQFGTARLFRLDVGILEHIHFRLFGVADPAHFVRSEYFKRYIEGLAPVSILDAGCGAGDYASIWRNDSRMYGSLV